MSSEGRGGRSLHTSQIPISLEAASWPQCTGDHCNESYCSLGPATPQTALISHEAEHLGKPNSMVITLWNRLPREVMEIPSFESFKIRLDKKTIKNILQEMIPAEDDISLSHLCDSHSRDLLLCFLNIKSKTCSFNWDGFYFR